MSAIEPFRLSVLQTELEDMYHRIDRTRWPEKEPVDDWSHGVPLGELQDLVEYWRRDYDWRACETRLNDFGQYRTTIDDLAIHFLHVRSPRDDALPLILSHGWPGSVREFFELIPLLTQPADAGAPAFHVVVPSLPGYGFSAKPATTGWDVARIAAAWARLMARLGYDRWVAQGGDWGAMITMAIGRQAPPGCVGIHTNMPLAPPPPEVLDNPDPDPDPDPESARALASLKAYQDEDSGYAKVQSTRPQTIGYSLVDSPVGLAAWIFEKMHRWTDNDGSPFDALSRDAILDNIMIYWLSRSGASAARLYRESFATSLAGDPIDLPVGVSQFPREVMPTPRTWCERTMRDIVYWNEPEKGGHFAAWEQPDIFARELRACFARMP